MICCVLSAIIICAGLSPSQRLPANASTRIAEPYLGGHACMGRPTLKGGCAHAPEE